MKDVFELIQDEERRFYGDEDNNREHSQCQVCLGYFHPEQLTRTGEQVVAGKYVANCRSCYACAPTDFE
jgi:hypothetical protein